jgi:HEAT repeat protein
MTVKFLKTCIILLFSGLLAQFCGCNSNPATSNTKVNPLITVDTGNLQQEATRIIKDAFASSEPRVRTNAIEAVAAIPVKRGRIFMPEVQRLLTDDFVPVRFTAAVAVGDTAYEPAKNRVYQLLKDKDQNVRLAATYAISKLVPRASVELLRNGLTSPDLQVRANAAFLTGKTGNKNAIPLLYETLRNESSDDRVRLNCIEAIARLGDERIYQKIWALLISAYADDRIFGCRAMSALGSTQAKDALMTMLTDDLVEVRLVAAEQLGSLGDTVGEKVVIDSLTQPNPSASEPESKQRIDTLAALATGQIKTPALKKFLPDLLKNDSQFVKIAAAKAVFQFANSDNIGR